MVERDVFREAMSRMAGAVCVITTGGSFGDGGFTASAVCSVTDQPPTLLVCMNGSSRQRPVFTGNSVLCVNVLAGEQAEISAAFARPSVADPAARFEWGRWTRMGSGVLALDAAIANLETRIANIVEIGTHLVMFCEITAVRTAIASEALVYLDRSYRALSLPLRQ